jgi:hypothetical protein
MKKMNDFQVLKKATELVQTTICRNGEENTFFILTKAAMLVTPKDITWLHTCTNKSCGYEWESKLQKDICSGCGDESYSVVDKKTLTNKLVELEHSHISQALAEAVTP